FLLFERLHQHPVSERFYINCCHRLFSYSLLCFWVRPPTPKSFGAIGKFVSAKCARHPAHFFLFSSTTSNSASTTSPPSRLPAPSSAPPPGCASCPGCGPGRGPACADACL